eukprot:CAMPEP_0181240016 /NCGR_PEP_ID=MMETSP1096-20121128/40285_1 /TAXON_ID=156174 ORGANISM="Chrysochromulina ericina, Strain CCMP281" /NCGR_SAMPLE_ID=MMETSP1096 /ASSEMBLY_ACC=CAM_ASM_000453 /LENGTH=104 /DNA_ID=CAMNT_0023335837 /DNA_START=106 /DNA_END=417 /DNA_ORIENTATION=-
MQHLGQQAGGLDSAGTAQPTLCTSGTATDPARDEEAVSAVRVRPQRAEVEWRLRPCPASPILISRGFAKGPGREAGAHVLLEGRGDLLILGPLEGACGEAEPAA